MHSPIQIKDLDLSFPQKTCFKNFNAYINDGDRIGIIGNNGSGKSSLLKMIRDATKTSDHHILIPQDLIIGYVPQISEDDETLSGSEGFQKALTQSLHGNPNLLLLDEPTNHLDQKHRGRLRRFLKSYPGTLIIVSHDIKVLRETIDILWHIDNGIIHIFAGKYDDYIQKRRLERQTTEKKINLLDRQKKETHISLMHEQKRASKSKKKGEKSIDQRKWPTVVSKAKATRAEETSGKKSAAIASQKEELSDRLAQLRIPDIIKPTFSIKPSNISAQMILSIENGSIAYSGKEPLARSINLSLYQNDRLAILGDNGSGKTSLIRAILNNDLILKTGIWNLPKRHEIGYLDQHYKTLCPEKSVFETIADMKKNWSSIEVRRHLNDFLFKKNEEVTLRTNQLSGGERARLSLAQIAANTPKLLILDEITNNLDLETKQHVIEVLKAYPGAMIIISHDQDFLAEMNISKEYMISAVQRSSS